VTIEGRVTLEEETLEGVTAAEGVMGEVMEEEVVVEMAEEEEMVVVVVVVVAEEMAEEAMEEEVMVVAEEEVMKEAVNGVGGVVVVFLESVSDPLVWRRPFIWSLVLDYVIQLFLD